MTKEEWLAEQERWDNTPTGFRCKYCGCQFLKKHWGVHPPDMEMINGYPAVCRMTGKALFPKRLDEDDFEVWTGV